MPLTDRNHLVVRPTGADAVAVPIRGSGAYAVAGVELEIAVSDEQLTWAVVNGGPDVALDAVGFAWDAGPAGGDPRCFVHGYQSWAPTRARRLGVDEDPSRHPDSHAAFRAAYHADPGRTAPGELRSEQVTVVRGDGPPVCIGFDGGTHHAGTLRVAVAGGRIAVTAEAWLGGAVVPSGTRRDLHGVTVTSGDSPAALLDAWAGRVGRAERARVDAPFQVGWCSWYHYFERIDEAALRSNLARAGSWPFDVFQLDDGFQRAIGDWLTTTEAFPSGIDGVAGAIATAGYTPGLWLAPFLAAPDSAVAREHPEWLARDPVADRPAVGMLHEVWGGFMWQLDTTRPDVRDHLSGLARDLVSAGYRYLKLDFTFSAALPARVYDRTATPAERVRAGYDAIRAGAGDDVFILGCGAPLGPVVGLVDAMRIGADVAPWWDPPPGSAAIPGYEDAAPATSHAFTNTLSRAFQHRRLWLNDPDCLMLRSRETQLSPEAARAWALAVGCSGGLALVSDDLALLGADARTLLDEVLTLGREADEQARAGPAPVADDLLDPDGPSRLRSGGVQLDVDPTKPLAVMTGGDELSGYGGIRR